MVEECAQAGLQRVIFVTTERGKRQLKDYFERIDDTLEERYALLGKSSLVLAERARRAAYKLHYEYIIQSPTLYGTSVPPLLARPALQGEKWFFLMGGDDFVYHQDPTVSELALAMKTWQIADTDHVIMGKSVSRRAAAHLGVFFPDEQGNLTRWIEKPSPEAMPDTPQVTANISRYGFSDRIWEYLEEEAKIERQGEHQMTYPVLQALADGQTFRIHTVRGAYLGGGTAEELIASGRYIAEHPRQG